MVVSCCANNCSNRFAKDQLPHFHSFPKCKELREKWVIAIRRVNLKPNSHTKICGEHFLPEDYVVPGSSYLKKNSIPSKFDFPQHLQKVKKERKPPKRLFANNENIQEAEHSKNEQPKKTENKLSQQRRIKRNAHTERQKNKSFKSNHS